MSASRYNNIDIYKFDSKNVLTTTRFTDKVYHPSIVNKVWWIRQILKAKPDSIAQSFI